MDYYKLNKRLGIGLSDESVENVADFFHKISRLNIKLSKEEKALCQSLGIDDHLAAIVKSHKTGEIQQLPSCNEYYKMDFKNTAEGICARYAKQDNEIHRIIYRNKLKYLKAGCNLFYFSTENYQDLYMALVKGKTDLDILKWRKTDGINHGIDNPALVAKLEEWQQKYDFVLWGCGSDWLQIFFIHEMPQYDYQLGASNKKYYEKYKLWEERTPKFKKFADEVAEFCPDLITQVYGSKTKLINGMKAINGVYFWWD